MFGWRPTTNDIDIRLDPESDRVLREIEPLKNKLGINVEKASPADFIPVKDGWEERSPFVTQSGRITVRHFDLYAQALSKIERGHSKDLSDVQAMVDRYLIQPDRLLDYFNDIAVLLFRFPAIDADDFRTRVEEVVRNARPDRPKNLTPRDPNVSLPDRRDNSKRNR